jgi:hypothetical protein
MSCTSTVSLQGFDVNASGVGASQASPVITESVAFRNYTVANECTIERCDHIPDDPEDLTVDLEQGLVTWWERENGVFVYVEAEPVDGQFAYNGPVSQISEFPEETATFKTKRGWKKTKTYFSRGTEEKEGDPISHDRHQEEGSEEGEEEFQTGRKQNQVE